LDFCFTDKSQELIFDVASLENSVPDVSAEVKANLEEQLQHAQNQFGKHLRTIKDG
jgi:hypothetical protein